MTRISTSASLTRVVRGALCSGCGGCALVAPDAIEMVTTDAGFARPRQTKPVSPVQDDAIAAICPGLGQKVDAAGRPDDPLWGPVLGLHRGWSTDKTLRHAASSGGGLSALVSHLLSTGQIDSVIQTAAADTPPFANKAVLSKTPEDILKAAGSRYAPSSPLANLEPYLAGQGRHAFVGKPCDVAALRALALRDPRVDQRITVMMSFFCAGVPSLKGAEAVLDKLQAPKDEVVSFRYRGMGWPGMATATLRDGTTRQMTYHASWGGVLSKHVQHRCKICADGTGKAADIVCADAWETNAEGYPVFEEEDGISLIVTRTPTGTRILREAEAAGALETDDFDKADLADMQPGQSGRRRALFARLWGLRLVGRPIPQYQGLNIYACARQNSFKSNLKNTLGMIRRVLQKRIDKL